MDEDLQKHEEQRKQRLQQEVTPEGQEPGTGFPEVSHRDQITPILPRNESKTRQHHFTEDIEAVEAPQRDAAATSTALAASRIAPTPERTTEGPLVEDEEWLDEDGKPMSAFRKSRLLRQGLRPPSFRSRSSHGSSSQQSQRDVPSFQPDPTRDPGGGADIDAISAVLSDVSRENYQKVRQMSAAEVSEELRSLESLFGKDVLEALRNRKNTSTPQDSDHVASSATQPDGISVKSTSNDVTGPSVSEEDKEGPLAIKRQYFPAEPEGPNPSLEWMMPQQSQLSVSTDLRFDFSGKPMQRELQTDDTYLSGLHHHGDDQEAPGYTFAELLHLSRSTVAAQRQLALNVLGRVCEHHPAFGDNKHPGGVAATNLLNEHALLLRARIISISRWLLGDRHFTVRAAALRCLASAVRSLPSGVLIPLGSAQELDFGRLVGASQSDADGKDSRDVASEIEKGIQRDWANVILESDIVSLFLDRIDSVITSTWEAELAVELLFRIASCSASHAMRVFEADPRKLCDFVIYLGLKVAWPPAPIESPLLGGARQRPSSLPSVIAVRLLHQGILSDRKIAESIVLSGSVEHLLRFVVTPPWKVEEDWVSDDEAGDAIVVTGYQIFDEVLQLFVSLASYGLFASVVARTWDLWQASSSWAVKQLLHNNQSEGDISKKVWINEARDIAAQRIFEILAAWTHCAMDPHELMTAHDITWTQVRDWIEPIKDAAQELATTTTARPSDQGPAFGALCTYIDAWVRCAISKEPKILDKYVESCQTILSHSHRPIQQHFLSSITLLPSAPTQTMALDEAEQACCACHRFLNVTRTMVRADRIKFGPSADEPALPEETRDVMLQESLALISSVSVWQTLQSLESRASGRHVYQQKFSDFIAAAMTTISGSRFDVTFELAASSRLDERYASRVAEVVLRATEALTETATALILRPFLLESISGANRLPEAGQTEAVGYNALPLSQVQSLFNPSMAHNSNKDTKPAENLQDAGSDDEEDEKDIDPITGFKLWKCPASGLPLRADWPLLILDDLLHSANTAVFNRPDNLDEDWKPSEMEMVRASLRLAVAVFRAMLQRSKQPSIGRSIEAANDAAIQETQAMLSSLPSPEQILLGVSKVFMLEQGQSDTFTDKTVAGVALQKQSGMITGRDLFRDPGISSELTSLLDIVDELVELRQQHPHRTLMSTVTLDAWTNNTYGSSVSFYQFFTNLVGLWDSVSFGDINFARTVMTIANAGCGGVFEGDHGVAVDFRRLLWNDYSDGLRSMPSTTVANWLLSWTDKDQDMLEHYCRYLASAAEGKTARQSMAWQIAVNHVGAAIELLDHRQANGAAQSKRVETILRSLLVAKGEPLLREIFEARVKASTGINVADDHLERLVSKLQVSAEEQ